MNILLGDEYPKKVAFIRNGMLITDNLHRLQRFPGMKNFVAVVECKSSDGNELLKQMEPPRHDEFQPERLATEDDRRKGRAALKQLSELVRNYLNTHAQNPVEEEINLSELSDLLGSDAIGADPAKEGEINPNGKIVLAARPKPNQNRSRMSEAVNQGLGEGFDGTGGETGATPSGTGNNDGVGTGDNAAGDGDQSGVNNGGDKSRPRPMSLRNVLGIRLMSTGN